jgi:hypothetical protein
MRADDDGFINNPKKIQRMIGASDDDARILVMKKFLIPFESGVVVIKHWKIHNYIRNDRYKETVYQEEKAQLVEKENKAYSLGIPNGYQMDTQVRLGKDSIGKLSIEENICPDSGEPEPPAPAKKEKPVKHKHGEYKNVLLTDEELQKLKSEYSDYEERIERLSSYVASTGKSYKSHYATIRNWARKDAEKKPTGRTEMVPGWMKKKDLNNFERRRYDMDSLEGALLNTDKPKLSEEYIQRVEALKNELGAS